MSRFSNFLSYFLILVCGSILISCGSDNDDGGSNPPPQTLNFTALVNEVDWVAVSSTSTHDFLCSTLMVEGTASDGSVIQLFYSGVDAPQSYVLTDESVSYMKYINPNGVSYLSSATPSTNAGAIVLMEFNGGDEISSGQFNGATYGSSLSPIVITNGVFEDISFDTNTTNTVCPEVEDEDPDDPEYPALMISYYRNGIYFETDNLVNDLSNSVRVEQLYGQNGNVITFHFDRDAQPGTYSAINSDGFNVSATIGFIIYYNVSGNIELTVHDTVAHFIQGTFDLEIEKSGLPATPASITEGKFAVHY